MQFPPMINGRGVVFFCLGFVRSHRSRLGRCRLCPRPAKRKVFNENANLLSRVLEIYYYSPLFTALFLLYFFIPFPPLARPERSRFPSVAPVKP